MPVDTIHQVSEFITNPSLQIIALSHFIFPELFYLLFFFLLYEYQNVKLHYNLNICMRHPLFLLWPSTQ